MKKVILILVIVASFIGLHLSGNMFLIIFAAGAAIMLNELVEEEQEGEDTPGSRAQGKE